MAEIMGVRFKNVGKIYYFDPAGHVARKGDRVIVETARGTECGEVVMGNREVDDAQVPQPLKKVLRLADEQDLEKISKNREREAHAFSICSQKIAAHKLDMKLIDVEYTFDNNKILFYFTADGRVDFRELVKDLASVLKTRIELRQIGVRDEAKMLGGLGICGRPFCCSTFLGEFQPVSIKMAKEQGLSLNPAKISGTCGRLMCCLKYEQAAYEDLLKRTPKQGSYVVTPDGKGTVTEVSLLTGNLKVVLDRYSNDTATVYHRDQISLSSEPRPPREPRQGGGQLRQNRDDRPEREQRTANREATATRAAKPAGEAQRSDGRKPDGAASEQPRRRRRRGGRRQGDKKQGERRPPGENKGQGQENS